MEQNQPDYNWVLDELLQADLLAKGQYMDSTEDDQMDLYHQYPVDVLLEYLKKFTQEEQYASCNLIRQVLDEKNIVQPLIAVG